MDMPYSSLTRGVPTWHASGAPDEVASRHDIAFLGSPVLSQDYPLGPRPTVPCQQDDTLIERRVSQLLGSYEHRPWPQRGTVRNFSSWEGNKRGSGGGGGVRGCVKGESASPKAEYRHSQENSCPAQTHSG
jgi:hypothetical protein